MSLNKRGLHDTPCEACNKVSECEARGYIDPCRAFRRYTREGQHDAIPWVPEDRGVFDGIMGG